MKAAVLFVAVATALWFALFSAHFQGDFASLWGGAMVVRGGGNPYLDPLYIDGAPFPRPDFTHPPTLAILLAPLTGLDYDAARAWWYALEMAALVALFAITTVSVRRALLMATAALLAAPFAVFPVFTHLERGQIDLFVACAAAASFKLWSAGRSSAAGGLLGVACVIKWPAVLFLAAPMAWRDYRFVRTTVVILALAAAAAVGVYGPRVQEYVSLIEVIDRGAGVIPDFRPPSLESPAVRWNDRDYVYSSFTGADASVTRRLGRRLGYGRARLAGGAALVLTFIVLAWSRPRQPASPEQHARAWFAGVAGMLAFQPMTWVMGLVHLIPLALLFYDNPGIVKPAWVRWCVVAGLALAFSGDVVAGYLPARLASTRVPLGLLMTWAPLLLAAATDKVQASRGISPAACV